MISVIKSLDLYVLEFVKSYLVRVKKTKKYLLSPFSIWIETIDRW